LLVALMGLDVGQGNEVITTPYTFFATAGVIARVGARPMFCDIDPVSYNLSPESVKNTIDEKCEVKGGKLYNKQTGGEVKVLLPVHLYGQTADMEPLMAIASEYGLKVIEDAAQAIGSEYKGNRRAGSIGDIGCFSFFPSKNLGAFGDGGMCTTTDPELGEKLRILRVHGSKPKYYHALIGGNFRLDELQAAVLTIKLKYLDEWTSGRQKNAAYYNELFSNAGLSQISTPVAVDGYRHIYNQYVIRTQDRDKLRQHLADANIGSEIYYPVPLHVQDCFNYLGYKADDCPEAMKAAEETLAIPIYPELSKEQQEYVVDKISEFYK
jgi:dTDP-4-amino-4,6-dideoxygalactose transaminase